MRFRATLLLAGKTAIGIRVPAEVVESLGKGKRPPVRVTINGHTYRNTVAVRGGEFMLPVSAEQREGAGVAACDEVDVDVELDTKPRELTLPTSRARSTVTRTPSGTSKGCPTATSGGSCSPSRAPRPPRPGSDGSTKRSALLREGRT